MRADNPDIIHTWYCIDEEGNPKTRRTVSTTTLEKMEFWEVPAALLLRKGAQKITVVWSELVPNPGIETWEVYE